MNKEAFTQGFIKRAEDYGATTQQAQNLAKYAGFWSGVGNFANDMFVRPATGMVRDTGRALHAFGEGRFGDGFKATGSALGNTALTAMNFLPVGGLGGAAVRGGLGLAAKGLGMGARAAQLGVEGGRLARAGGLLNRGANLATRAQGAVAQGQAAGRAGVMNFLDRNVSKLRDRVIKPPTVMPSATAAPGEAAAFQFRRSTQPVSNLLNRAQGNIFSNYALNGVPATTGMIGYAGNAGDRAEQERLEQGRYFEV